MKKRSEEKKAAIKNWDDREVLMIGSRTIEA
mgnify:CR=1 FL=1